MKTNNSELIIENVEFIREYINTLMNNHPELEVSEAEVFAKIQRRLRDIEKRVGA